MGRIHRSGKEFHPKITSPDDDDAVEANIPLSQIDHPDNVYVTALPDTISPYDVEANIPPGVSHTSSHAPAVEEVPKFIHGLIQEALTIRDKLGWKKEAVDSNEELQFMERRIQILSKLYIPEFLPYDWKYDPITARNLRPKKTLNRPTIVRRTLRLRPRIKKTCVSDRCNHNFPRSNNGKPPTVYETPITKEMETSWREFKRFDKKKPTLKYYSMTEEGLKTPIRCDHPFVKVISNFALNSFNQALDTRVIYKQGKLSDLEVIECYYFKLKPDYWFYMTVKANEDGKRGVYHVKVETAFDNGMTTLCKFDFVRFDDDGSMEVDEGQDCEYDPNDYRCSGLVRRSITRREVSRKGYDYRNQFRFDRIFKM